MNDKIYNIYYCSDNNGLELLKQSIRSIIKNCTSTYTVHCLLLGVDEIDGFCDELNVVDNVKVKAYDCSGVLDGKFEDYSDTASIKHITKTTMLRMFPDKFIDLSEMDKLLYLDTDTYINKDLKELFEIDLTGYYLGAVRDFYTIFSKHFAYKEHEFYKERVMKKNYFNGGVELLNVRKMVDENKFKEMQEFNLMPYMKFTDQDIYNFLFEGGVKLIDPKYNCKCWMNFIKNDVTIIHAAGCKNKLEVLKKVDNNIQVCHSRRKYFAYYKIENYNADIEMNKNKNRGI